MSDIDWAEKLKEIYERDLAEAAAPVAEPAPNGVVHDADLIPDVEYEPNPLDEVLDRFDILDAYRRWCGKSDPDPRGKTEGIMISCPHPAHPDANPSAWINTDNQTWYCGACDLGGDKYDIAAYRFGYAVPEYKSKAQFPKLRTQMAEDLGYTVVKKISGGTYLAEPDTEPEALSSPPDTEEEGLAPPGNVVGLTLPTGEPGATVITGPFGTIQVGVNYDDKKVHINWRRIIPEGTFLYEWMKQTTPTDEPNEYLFWLGLAALGAAAGNNVRLWDDPPVRPNLYLCLIGASGSRKSRAVHRLKTFLHEALPYDASDPDSTGTLSVATPASAETLVDAFSKPIRDDIDPKMIIGFASVRGLVTFEELSDFTNRAERKGNVLKPTLMEFFDSLNDIAIRSRAHGEVRAKNHFCQIVTTTQPKAVRELMDRTDVDSGFLNRWIFVKSVEKSRRALGGSVVDLSEAVTLLRGTRAWCTPRSPTLIGSAEATFNEVFHDFIVPILDSENTMLGRLDLMFKKLVILFCINEKTSAPMPDVIERAAELLDYLVHTYEVTDKNIGYGPFEDCCEAIQEAIRQFSTSRTREPTMREIRTLVPKRFNADLLQKSMKALITVGVLEEIVQPKTKTTRFRITA